MIVVADVLFMIGAVLQALTGHVWGMIVGRSIVGLAVGSASLVTPLYVDFLISCVTDLWHMLTVCGGADISQSWLRLMLEDNW